MLLETVSFFACFIILALIGIGPALLLVSTKGERRIIYAFGIAPALGMSIIALTGFLLVRYMAPIKTWAEIVTALLVLVSFIILANDWKLNRRDYSVFTDGRRAVVAAIFLFVCTLILSGTMLSGGMQYSIFLNNATDAFTYMSMAESLRVVDWQTLFNGADMRNLQGVANLAEKSPAALFSARFILMPYRLGSCILLGWASEIVNIPVYAFYYAFNLLSFAAAIPVSLSLCARLGLKLYMRLGVAAAIALGFLPHFIREQDISSQMNSIPLFLLVAFAWMQLEHEPLRKISRARVLLAVSISAIMCYYPETLSPLALSFVIYYALGILYKTVSPIEVRYHIYTIVLIFIISMGQVDYHLRSISLGYGNIFNSVPYTTESHILTFLEKDFFLTAWGLLPLMSNLANLPNTNFWDLSAARNLYYSHEGIKTLLHLVGGILSLSLVSALILMTRKKNETADKIVFSFIAASLITFTIFYFRNNYYPAGKALMLFYPFYFLALPLLPKYLSDYKYLAFKPIRVFLSLLITLWLVLQSALGFNWIDMARYQRMVIDVVSQPKPEQYDISAITDYLDKNPPSLLLVNIPRVKTWAFPYYAIFVFSKYRSYFQDGIIIDNGFDVNDNFPAGGLTEMPDYAVISKSVDYIGPNNLGAKLSETNDIVLYRITTEDIGELMKVPVRANHKQYNTTKKMGT
ncbi:MAG: hypothetical protein HZB61_01625 [Nitrospirae bacterium]|nr:hypothetical protein [Nitrospirota bacterium]